MIIVAPPGSTVNMGGDIGAVITQVCVGPKNAVSYEVSWWNGRAHCKEWFQECEVNTTKCPSLQIGFNPQTPIL